MAPFIDLDVKGSRALEWLQKVGDSVFMNLNGEWSFHVTVRTNHKDVVFRFHVVTGDVDMNVEDVIYVRFKEDVQCFPLTDVVGPLMFFGTRMTRYPDLRPVRTWTPKGTDMNKLLPRAESVQ
jgi:hypothetical protein